MAASAKARELAGDRAARIVAERGRDLHPQQVQRALAYPADHGLDLSATRVERLRGEDDQQPQEGGARACQRRPPRPLPGAAPGARGRRVRSGRSAKKRSAPRSMTASRILDGDYHDPRSAWQRYRQNASDGAILVRPDRFIAWRSPAAASDPGPRSPPRSARTLGADRLLRAGPAGS